MIHVMMLFIHLMAFMFFIPVLPFTIIAHILLAKG